MSSRLFDEARRLISRAVIEALLPDGQWRSDGDYWVRSPLRADSNIGSFHITAEGLWKDFATEEGGDLVQLIQNTVPEPSPIEDARFISARTLDHGEFRTLAKIDGIWYDHNGDDYMDIELLANYDEIEVIK